MSDFSGLDNPYDPTARLKRAVVRDRHKRDTKALRRAARAANLAQQQAEAIANGTDGVEMRDLLMTVDGRENPAPFDEGAQAIADLCCMRYAEVSVGQYDYAMKQPGGKPQPFGPKNPFGRRRVDKRLLKDNDLYLKDLAKQDDIDVRSSDDEDLRMLQFFARTLYRVSPPASPLAAASS